MTLKKLSEPGSALKASHRSFFKLTSAAGKSGVIHRLAGCGVSGACTRDSSASPKRLLSSLTESWVRAFNGLSCKNVPLSLSAGSWKYPSGRVVILFPRKSSWVKKGKSSTPAGHCVSRFWLTFRLRNSVIWLKSGRCSSLLWLRSSTLRFFKVASLLAAAGVSANLFLCNLSVLSPCSVKSDSGSSRRWVDSKLSSFRLGKRFKKAS